MPQRVQTSGNLSKAIGHHSLSGDANASSECDSSEEVTGRSGASRSRFSYPSTRGVVPMAQAFLSSSAQDRIGSAPAKMPASEPGAGRRTLRPAPGVGARL